MICNGVRDVGLREVPTVIGRLLIVVVGNQCALVGANGLDQVVEPGIVVTGRGVRVALDIEFLAWKSVHQRLEHVDVLSVNMSCVRTRVNGDAGGACLQSDSRYRHHVRPRAGP